MANQVTLTIDDLTVTVPEGTLVVDAARKAGIDIPVFCYHPKMEPVGMCRMCLVQVGRPMVDRATGQPVLDADGQPKIQFSPKLETSCTIPVSEGMVIRTNTPEVLRAHRDIIEFLLTSHPLDCPICDKGGECPLQDLTRAYGPGQSRFLLDDKMRLAKHVPLGELIYLDRERCILCARCIRFQDEIVDEPVLSFYHRGRSMQIVTYSDPPFDSYFSGNTTDICPVGALTTADFRFAARPWELKNNASICTQCPVGCNTTLNTRREVKSGGKWVVKRVMPRQNELVNEIWICDKGRFGYHYAESGERILSPHVRKEQGLVPVSWDEALDLVEQRLRQAGAGTVTLAGGRLANEDLFNLAQVTDHLGGRKLLHTQVGGGEYVQRYGLGKGSNLGELGKGDAILVIASDLQEEAPVWWLRVKRAADRGAALMVLNPRPTRLDPYARFIHHYRYGEELEALGRLAAGEGELAEAAEALRSAENLVIFYGSEGLGLAETTALAREAAGLLAGSGRAGKVNSGLIGVWQQNNTLGAYDMGFRPEADLAGALSGSGLAWIAAADPAGDHPALEAALKQAGFLVVQDLFMTRTAQMADVVLPAQAFTEREGTFTSGERRVQRFYPAVAAPPGPLADFSIAARVGLRVGIELEGASAATVMLRIAASVPAYAGLDYALISEVSEQWPIIGREDRYYGGTGYDNHQGLGVQLQPDAVTDPDGEVSIAMAAPAPLQVPEGAVYLAPVTRLYDQGLTLKPSMQLVGQRMARREVWLNPETAARLGFGAASLVTLEGEGWTASGVEIRVDEQLPPDVLLAPRSVGIPATGPEAVRLRPLVTEPEA